MRQVLAFTTIALVAASAFGISRWHGTRPVQAHPQGAEQSQPSADVNRFAESIEMLGQSITALSHRMDGLEARSNHRTTGNSPGADAPGESAAARRTPETRKQDLAYAREEAMDRLGVIEDSFRNEKRDQSWASGMITKLDSTFRDGNFAGTKLVSTDCRTTFCRMEVSHENADSSSNFELIRRQVPGSYYMQHLEPDENGQSRTVAFFVREGRDKENAIGSIMGRRQ